MTIKWTPPMPEDIPEGKFPHWDGDNWVMKDVDPPVSNPEPMDPILSCKLVARNYLTATDYAMLPDVKISNRSEFEAFREEVRKLYLNPVANPVWPAMPDPIWIK